MVRWFQEDQMREIFSGSRLADLGPQGLSRTGGKRSVARQYPSGSRGLDLYFKLGIRDYVAFDLLDDSAQKCDFNNPPRGTGDFDVVTNFGTSEHIFNQSAMMRFMHELTRVGGVMFHVVPVAGGRDHGFFNYHPCFFWDLARANNYEVLTLDYFPHYGIQSQFARRASRIDLRRYTKQKRMKTISDEAEIKKASIGLFCRPEMIGMNLRILGRVLRNPKRTWGPFFDVYRIGDYVHVALRKTTEREFSMPIQGVYS